MEQFIKTYQNLAYCYRKIGYENEYLRTPEDERNKICAYEKGKFLEALNSEDMKFSNVINLRLKNTECKFSYLC